MINKKKKKYQDISKYGYDVSRTDSSESTSRGYSYNMNKFGPHEDKSSSSNTKKFANIGGLKESNEADIDVVNTKLSKFGVKTKAEDSLVGSQIDGIQTAMNDRTDAEESNLDILDRGSRYKRKNEKLKKFKE